MALLTVNWKPDRRTLRRFGLVALVAFGALGAWVFFREHFFALALSPSAARAIGVALWCVAGASGVLAAVAPQALRWLYAGLTLVTLPIGLVISHIVMAALYYLVFTPTALVFRLIGRDALHRKADPSAKSYWQPRKQAEDVRRYFRQF